MTNTKALPRNAHSLIGMCRERVEHIQLLCPDLYSPAKILELFDELQERLVLDQLSASAASLGLDRRHVEPLTFDSLETWPEGEELTPAEKQELFRSGDEI